MVLDVGGRGDQPRDDGPHGGEFVRREHVGDDQEPALIAFLQMVRRALMDEVAFENSPVGDSQSHGAAEQAFQTVQCHTHTLRDAVQHHFGTTIPPNQAASSGDKSALKVGTFVPFGKVV